MPIRPGTHRLSTLLSFTLLSFTLHPSVCAAEASLCLRTCGSSGDLLVDLLSTRRTC